MTHDDRNYSDDDMRHLCDLLSELSRREEFRWLDAASWIDACTRVGTGEFPEREVVAACARVIARIADP